MEESALNSVKPRILFILHLPPPVHGAAVMGKTVRDSALVAEAFEAHWINLSASSALAEVGRVSLRKIRFLVRLLRNIRKEVRTFRPDAVYFTPTSYGFGLVKDVLSVRLVRRMGIRPLLHFHNKGVSTRQDRWLYHLLYRGLFKDAKVILQSENLYPDVSRYVVREDACFCPNGIDAPACPGREEHPVPELLFLSNLLPEKGVEDLLDACKLLKDRKFTCRFVGAPTPDIDAGRLHLLSAERGVEDIVRYDGPLYGSDKQAAWAGADVFVLPTHNDCFPLVVLEAMAAGLPVVSTREGGIPEEVEDGVTGLLCDKESPESLADSLRFVLDDPALRRRMGEAGRERYGRLFTREAFERRMVEILKENV